MITGAGTFGAGQSQQNCSYTYNSIGNLTDKCGSTLSYGDSMHPSAVTNHAGLEQELHLRRQRQHADEGQPDPHLGHRQPGQQYCHLRRRQHFDGVRLWRCAGEEERSGRYLTIYPFSGYEIDPNGVVIKYIRIGDENVAAKRGTNKYFYHNDHLGSVNVVTDINGTRVQLVEYDPWGTISRSEGTIDPTHRFTGKELDPETGLYYYGGRYYDAEIGRFISADPFVQTPFDPQNLNRYSYVLNSPQNYTDPERVFPQA